MKFRHELKYTISSEERMRLCNKLRALFKHDRYAGAHGEYRARSLYFDNLYDKALKEKVSGLKGREKFRIRYYNDDLNFIRLEKKVKNNALVFKRSAGLSKEQVAKLLKNDIEWMPEAENDLIYELYSKMKGQGLMPRTIVEYVREPFVFEPGNVRITIDRDLKTGISGLDFLEVAKPLFAAADTISSVLEVKYDEFFPDIVADAVGFIGRRTGAYSKYAVCRRFD